MKILLIGIGRWGANHLRVLHSLPVELFVSELDGKRLESARKLGVAESHLSTDYKALAGRVDGVVIVTPAPSHFGLCREMLEAGKDVFVEKPLTLVPEESLQLAELAEQTGRILQVGHIFRFDPAAQWLREAVREGKFGRVHILRGHFGGFKRPRHDSGVMFADGIHFVDLFNYILDATPRSVLAIHHDFMGRGMEDVSLVSLEYETPAGRTWATVENDYFYPGKFREVIVVGEKCSAVCDFNAAQYKIKVHENRHAREGNDFKAVEGAVRQIECAPEEPLLAELRAFVKSAQTREKPLADGRAGHEAVRVLDAALQSAKMGQAVKLK
ncbi:MAG: Gfo/Idh/MocA family oxidoreductase [Verrucomicrobiota bacterium]|jgi:UDP-2-acetamido-3-amino-2,3-dideoxy-glucuronate N-acetyltransferase